ncbi:helix-turn-helix domain-containing protein [Streptosporangium sp. NPDC023615]|uniref:helix-turn-helix domain-containing protein n=1 Tax=Streptosporangium sp. NPDC023615 TaxID=3154794 RepID=UPI0034164077
MTDLIFDSNSLPASERLDSWRELTCASLIPTIMDSELGEKFQASMRLQAHGPVQVSVVTCSALTSVRSSGLVRRSDPEVYFIALIQQGKLGLAHAGKEVDVSTGDLVLYDSSRPFSAHMIPPTPWSRKVLVSVPKTHLPLPPKRVDPLLGTNIGAGNGLGDILSYLITRAALPAPSESPGQGRFSDALLDLLTVLLGHLAGDIPVPHEARHHGLLLQIRAFVTANLGDPRLTPQAIAEAHGISLRQLNRLFHDEELPVATWIRQRRLARCHRDLADPTLRSQAIHVIAGHWGFTDAPSFTRAFRARYGMTPSEHRQVALGAGGHAKTRKFD